MTKDNMDDDQEIFDLNFHTFGKNATRTKALDTLWFDVLIEEVETEEMPEDAKRKLIFMMTSAAVLDVVMQSLHPKLAEVLANELDNYIGILMVNNRFGVDMMQDIEDAFLKHHGKEFASEEDYIAIKEEFDDKWWNAPKQALGGRTPWDAVKEEKFNAGLEREMVIRKE